jgi:branched-chain amino acid transport system substrate-binding protein
LDMLKRYQAKSADAGVDLLGYYLPPFAYAMMQVLQQSVEATKSLDDEKLAAYLRDTTFQTVAGPIKFNEQGEWVEARVLEVQFQGVQGNGIEQFRDLTAEKIIWPPAYKTGDVIYPYGDAKK